MGLVEFFDIRAEVDDRNWTIEQLRESGRYTDVTDYLAPFLLKEKPQKRVVQFGWYISDTSHATIVHVTRELTGLGVEPAGVPELHTFAHIAQTKVLEVIEQKGQARVLALKVQEGKNSQILVPQIVKGFRGGLIFGVAFIMITPITAKDRCLVVR